MAESTLFAKRLFTKDEYGNFIEPAEYEETGKYLLQLRGDYYIKYRKEQNAKERKENFHKRAAFIISLLALGVAGLSLVLDFIQVTSK